MDVGTLGKFLVQGPQAREFLDRLMPVEHPVACEGKSRYTLYLNEAGHIFDDGMIAALADDGVLRDGHVERRRRCRGVDAGLGRDLALAVHIVNLNWGIRRDQRYGTACSTCCPLTK